MSDTDEPVWCVVANVVHERRFGPGGIVIHRGTKHFAPGAKVHVVDFHWGMAGERVTVVGRHRKSKRYITLTMRSAHLANWRAELSYSPHVIREALADRGDGSGRREFGRFPQGGEASRLRAEEIASSYIKLGAAVQPFVTRPPSDSSPDH